jgi:hypothetical protein
MYFRLQFKNGGGASAVGCRVKLLDLYFVEYGVWKRLQGWEPITLNWANRVPGEPIELAAGEHVYCDVGHTVSNFIANNRQNHAQIRRFGAPPPGHPALMYLDAAILPAAQPNALAAGKYVLELQFVSTNTKTRRFACFLVFTGDYASLIEEPPEGTDFRMLKRVPEENTLA